ncbi:dihydrofolate reductase family protein [Gimesia fumaroli]|uniref:Dihydrofolate reductase n=1 Tax=Gimesia fumaroli TaxID=2527976 RepID=A0A518II03_9PLAN|nr:dihydrofolate reductase family protein [Gimesia fumaroli]QDV52715.1 Dihydrofolate reductase [Gimesia fumaroli]
MRVSVYIATSLDGFIARENGNLDWLPGSDGTSEQSEEDFGYHEFMDSVDVLIMGRKTFETVLSFEIEWPYSEKQVIVLSSQPLQIPNDLPATVESSTSSPAELIQQLSEKGYQRAYIDGGKTIQSFLNAGLIQDMIITRIPVLIGSGIPLFGPVDNDRKLRHINTRTFENGFVQSEYELEY